MPRPITILSLMGAMGLVAALVAVGICSLQITQTVIPEGSPNRADGYWTARFEKRRGGSSDSGSLTVSPAGDDSGDGRGRAFRTLQRAAVAAQPGDIVVVQDGEYPGGINIRKGGLPGRPIIFRAANIGKAFIQGDRVGPIYNKAGTLTPSQNAQAHDGVWINHADNVVFEGFVFQNCPRAGIRVDNSNGCAVRWCRAIKNGVTGIFTDYSDDTVIEYNESAFNKEQHGVYVSNSGDRPILRFNSCHDNGRAGIQLNGDSKLIRAQLGTRGDGIIEGAVLEGNVIYNNGVNGGAGLNLLCVHKSRIANNLIYNNVAGGISLFNDHLRTRLEYGAKNNTIVFNTIYFKPGEGRYCITLKHGSTDNIIRNNILCGGRRGAYEYDDTSTFISENNLLWSMEKSPVAANQDTNQRYTFEQWKSQMKKDITSANVAPQFVNSTSAPFNFHLKPRSLNIKAHALAEAAVDVTGKRREGEKTIGCYQDD